MERIQEETVIFFALDSSFVGLHVVSVEEGLDIVVVDRICVVLVVDDVVTDGLVLDPWLLLNICDFS